MRDERWKGLHAREVARDRHPPVAGARPFAAGPGGGRASHASGPPAIAWPPAGAPRGWAGLRKQPSPGGPTEDSPQNDRAGAPDLGRRSDVLPLGPDHPGAGPELFAPAREAIQALQDARRAHAGELARGDLYLADLSFEEATQALHPSCAPSDVAKAIHLFRLAAAQAKVAETRAIEMVRHLEAGAAIARLLHTMEGDPKSGLLPRRCVSEAAAEYGLRQQEAVEARAARRAAEEALTQRRNTRG